MQEKHVVELVFRLNKEVLLPFNPQ